MNDYPVMSMSKFKSLLGGLTRRNAGRPGNSSDPAKAETSKRVYGPTPGSEQIAAFLFYRGSFKPEQVKKFLDDHDLREFAPRETTPAFYRSRIKKVSNFDKNELKTYRLKSQPDVLVITGRLLTADEKEKSGRKATAYVPRIKTLRAAGWNVTSEAERKQATEKVAQIEARLEKLKERVGKDGYRPSPTDGKNAARWLHKDAPEGSAVKSKPLADIEEDLMVKADSDKVGVAQALRGRAAIGNLLIEELKASLSAARKASTRIATATSGPRKLPEGITDEMVADYVSLQKKHVKADSPYYRSASEIRTLAIGETATFLANLAKLKETDAKSGGESTARSAKQAPVSSGSAIPRPGAASAAGERDPAARIDTIATAALRKIAKIEAKAARERLAGMLDEAVATPGFESLRTDDDALREFAENLASVFQKMKAAGISGSGYATATWADYVGDTGEEVEEEEEEEVQENPRRRAPSARRPTSLVKRTPQKWAAIEKAQKHAHRLATDVNAADLALSKVKGLLARLRGKRTAQATYARQQLQAEATRLTRRIAKLNAELARAHKATIKAVKAANKKPAKKRRSR